MGFTATDAAAIVLSTTRATGENVGDAEGPFVVYLKALQAFDRRFPGFEHDLHGVEHLDGDYVIYVVN